MKKTLRNIFLTLMLVSLLLVGVTACANEEPTNTPKKLSAPVVTLNGNLATWQEDLNADKFEISLNGNLSYVENTVTSRTLTNGQTLKVRAIGDGVAFTNSVWSNTVTYSSGVTPPPTPGTTQAPEYLGIIASNEQPSNSQVPPTITYSAFTQSQSLEDRIKTYFTENTLGDTMPTQSDYPIYSQIGQTVYIQIWLNNPDQNTILSLKLNEVKYQTGGDLKSFFIQSGNTYLNCVYVAVAIPTNSYQEIDYQVTEIEYVEGANVSQDGKDVMIDQNNDTVTIGLPYQQSMPTATLSNGVATSTSVSFDVNVVDQDGFVNLVGCWLRAVIYNQNGEVIGQRKIANVNDTITFNDLSAETYYVVTVVVFGDVRDGNGVYPHCIANSGLRTESVITCESTAEILLNQTTGKYYPQISVNAELADSSFTFTKIEIGTWQEVLYTFDFDGTINITEGILNGESYLIKVYYENALGVEQSHTDSVYVDRLDYPWIYGHDFDYGLIDDGILGFDLGENKCNFDNLTIKIIDEYSKQYLAEDALYLIAHPNAVAELEAQWRNYGEGWEEIYDRWYKLEGAQTKINDYYPDVEKAEWESQLAKGIYSYEFVCGQDDEFFKGVGNKYYVVLNDYQSKRVNDYSWKYLLTADFDMNDGEGVEENRKIVEGFFDIEPAIGKNDYMFDEEFTLEDGIVYLEVKSRNNLGGESYRQLGYVNQIVLADGYDIVAVLWSQDEPNYDIDENAWMTNAINALKAGEEVNSVFPLGNLEPISFDINQVDIPEGVIGDFSIRFTFKMYGKTYNQDKPYDWSGATLDYKVYGQLPQASVSIITTPTENYGEYNIVIPQTLNNGRWSNYTVEIRDENQESLGTFIESEITSNFLSANYSIRVRLEPDSYYDYYLQGEWSEWFVCSTAKCDTPEIVNCEYAQDGVRLYWRSVAGAVEYVYVLNDGAETRVGENNISGLKNGDRFKVKAIPSEESSALDSDYSEVYTVVDQRTVLNTPIVTFNEESFTLEWQVVENAVAYRVYNALTGEVVYEYHGYNSCSIEIGKYYTVKAIPADYQTYAPSISAQVDCRVKLDAPEITIESEVVRFSSYKIGARVTYVYIINDGEEQTTTKQMVEIELNSGDTIKVKATCPSVGYTDSDWAQATR